MTAFPPGVLDALAEQQRALPPSPAREASLEALARGACSLVATGQQVGLFLGPLYSFYKAATAVRLAQRVSGAGGQRCAPLFWMASEDHDIAEVDHCFAADPDEPLPRRLALYQRQADVPDDDSDRVCVGQRVLGPSVQRCLDELAESLQGLPHAEQTMALFGGAYRPERTFAEAFAQVLGALFAEQGLLVFDPRDLRVAAAAAPHVAVCIERAAEIAEALSQRADELVRDGARAPVHVRPGAPLCFYHPRGPNGPRYRLEPAGEGYYTLVGAEGAAPLARAELLEALARDPLCFSSSALLRPVLQDALLPVSHVVGGPSEVDYLAQLPPLYAALDVTASEVVRRHGFRLISTEVATALGLLELDAATLCEASDEALEAHLAQLASRRAARESDHGDQALVTPQTLELELLAGFEARLDRLERDLTRTGEPLEPALRSGIDKTRASVTRSVSKLVSRYRRVLAAEDAVARSRLARARDELMPTGVPQERLLSLPYFMARYGIDELRDRVLAAIDDPRAGQTVDLVL
ncbi:MAG: bacillithiol biosynthesis cysteine-adding enzyme BshC [Myxococcales bacterium]|nr:bacillithiol biosynthesis cysteine-adding enzyme BshC [Myxococcales bacterium]